MSPRPATHAPLPPPLCRALRAVRLARGISVTEAAAAMGISQRAYYRFETEGAGATAARLAAFGRALDCDAVALALCAQGADSALVLACADNKAMTLAAAVLGDLRAELSTAFAMLTGADLLGALDEAARRLRADAMARSRARSRQAEDAAEAGPVTPRQLECLRWAQAGKSATDIGEILGISARTAEFHLNEACGRLGVRTRIQAISAAIELGLLSPGPS